MDEEWRDVVGYEGLYKVSNLGNVYSYYVNRNLKGGYTLDGYRYVALRKDNVRKNKFVHRLVGIAFIDNPNNLPLINHKDENPRNNCVDNLEWCDHEYNNTYNNVHIRNSKKISKRVYGYNESCELVYEYYGVREAARKLNLNKGGICDSCNGKMPVYKNIVWSYNKLTHQEVARRFEEYYDNIDKFLSMNHKNNKTSKKVSQYELDGNFIKSYPSVQEASRQLGFSASSIYGVCNGEHKQAHGYVFKYV